MQRHTAGTFKKQRPGLECQPLCCWLSHPHPTFSCHLQVDHGEARLSGGLLIASELTIFLSFLFPHWRKACHFPNNCFLLLLQKSCIYALWGAEVQSTLLVIPPLRPGGETSPALPSCGHPITKLFRKGVSTSSLEAWDLSQWCFPNHSEMTNWKSVNCLPFPP